MFESIFVQDINGANLGEFVALGQEVIVGWPSEQLFLYKHANPGTTLWFAPGTRYTSNSFLRQLGTFAAWDQGNGINVRAVSRTDSVELTHTLSASRLAQLTGYPVETVRDVLRDFLTFPKA